MFWFVTKVHPFKIQKWNQRTKFKTEIANAMQRIERWKHNIKVENKKLCRFE